MFCDLDRRCWAGGLLAHPVRGCPRNLTLCRLFPGDLTIQSKVEGFAGELPEIDVPSRQAGQPSVM
jgi:hypothetical protein